MNQCIINRSDITNALEAVKGAVATKTFSPILTHVLIDGQYVFAFDSEIGIRFKLPVDTALKFNIRFDTIYNLIKTLDGEQVSFELEGSSSVKLHCGKHKSTMQQIIDKFPQPDMEGAESTTPSQVSTGFKEALERALVGAADNETEKVLGSVLVRTNRVYGTNRSTVVRCTLDPNAPLPEMLLSRKSVGELIRLGQPASVRLQGAWSIWDYGNLEFMARLREGAQDFPPIDMLMDQRYKVPGEDELVKIPDGFKASLARLLLFCGKEDMRVITRASMMGTELYAKAETGEAVEYIDYPQDTVPRGKGFNPEVMLKALPYSSFLFFGRNGMEPIYLKGTDCNFEFLQSPSVQS